MKLTGRSKHRKSEKTIEKLFEEYFPTEEERLDKQIKYYKDMLKRLKT